MSDILIGLAVVGVVLGSLWVLTGYVVRRENKYYNQDFTGPESDDMTDAEWANSQDAFDKQYPEF